MRKIASLIPSRVLTLLAVMLIFKVTASVVWEYRRYFPPDFAADFLQGREAYFWGGYHWAFYLHLVSGPAALVIGTILMSERFRRSKPAWHRRLGRLQVGWVLLLLTPSGLWMAWYAATGAIAGAGLALLGLATAVCIAFGWRCAVARQFAAHQRWMGRTYILLCSAIVIRIIGGAATVAQFDAVWLYPLSIWASWLVPLAVFEVVQSWHVLTPGFAGRRNHESHG
jgi:hypothetical protein